MVDVFILTFQGLFFVITFIAIIVKESNQTFEEKDKNKMVEEEIKEIKLEEFKQVLKPIKLLEEVKQARQVLGYEQFFRGSLMETDPCVACILKNELIRQDCCLNLIGSENPVSQAILEAQNQSNVLYSNFVDKIVEDLAVNRAKSLFKCEYANVKPYSGEQMNQIVLMALLSPGDTIMGLDLKSGGYLIHNSLINISGIWFKSVTYNVNPNTGLIDMLKVIKNTVIYKPKVIIAGSTTYSRIIDWRGFRKIADLVGAFLITDISYIAGLVVSNIFPSPFPYCHIVTSTTHNSLRGPKGGLILTNKFSIYKRVSYDLVGGPMIIAAKAVALLEASQPSFKVWIKSVLDNALIMYKRFLERGIKILRTDSHLIIIDLRSLNITGKFASVRLKQCYIVTKNIPYSYENITIGSCICTSRGMGQHEFKIIADIISDVLLHISEFKCLSSTMELETKKRVLKLTDNFRVKVL